MSPTPRILRTEFEYIPIEDAQAKVDRRREALRLSRNRSPVAGSSRNAEDKRQKVTSAPRRSASCRPTSPRGSRTRRSPSLRRNTDRSLSTKKVTYNNPAENKMREMRLRSERDRVQRLRQEVEQQKKQEAQEIQRLRKEVLRAECNKVLGNQAASTGTSASTGSNSKDQDGRAKVKQLLDLAEVLKKNREERKKEEEKAKIKAEIRRRAELRREEIEKNAKESREAVAIKRSMKILQDNWATDLKVRACRRQLITRLGVESTDPEDRDQTIEYIRLSKLTTILYRDSGDLGLPSVQTSSGSSSDSNSSSSSSSSDQGDTKKREKRKRSAKKIRNQEKKKKRD